MEYLIICNGLALTTLNYEVALKLTRKAERLGLQYSVLTANADTGSLTDSA